MQTRPRVLVVDDEVRGLELAQRILRRIADISVAESGEAALEIWAPDAFDLVVSDQRMPGMTGVELLARIAERAPGTGRILLTGYTDLEATIDAINLASVDAYLNKPCPPEHFRLTVGAVLRRVEIARENECLAARHRRLGDLGTAVREAVDGVTGLAAWIDGSDGEAMAQLKRAAEAAERLDAAWTEVDESDSD